MRRKKNKQREKTKVVWKVIGGVLLAVVTIGGVVYYLYRKARNGEVIEPESYMAVGLDKEELENVRSLVPEEKKEVFEENIEETQENEAECLEFWRRPHLRNLREGQHPSQEKKEQMEKLGIEHGENQTYVNGTNVNVLREKIAS